MLVISVFSRTPCSPPEPRCGIGSRMHSGQIAVAMVSVPRLLAPTVLTCEQCSDELDRYVELELKNAAADT
jgi:hypothetical protein